MSPMLAEELSRQWGEAALLRADVSNTSTGAAGTTMSSGTVTASNSQQTAADESRPTMVIADRTAFGGDEARP